MENNRPKSLAVKLIEGSDNNFRDPIATIFNNRGVKDYKLYLSMDDSVLHNPHLLKNNDMASELFVETLDNAYETTILCDCDPDGFTSAALVYNYMKDYGFKGKINVLFHTGKQHGLSEEIVVPETTKLLIIPDAGTNDVEQCKRLREQYGMDIIILDHHISDYENPYAVVVNNQMCDYPNKEFSGAGIVYKFLQVVDELTWSDYADHHLDLVALGNIADVMDMRSFETKHICQKGLAVIQNPLMEAFCQKNSYSIKDIPTIIDVQFYFVPCMNALIRIGTQEQKKLLFDAMTGSTEMFKYKKRGTTEPIDETAAQKVVREAVSCKAKQNRIKDKAIEDIQALIEKFHWDDNKILFCNASSVLEPSLTGVTAIKLADMYNRPCILLRKMKPRPDQQEDEEVIFGGSCRNIDGSPITNLKEFLLSTNQFDFVMGHENAAGIQIKKSNIQNAIAACNEMLKDVELKKYYMVDFDMDATDLDVGLIRTVYKLRRAWGQGVPEPLFMIRNIRLERTGMHIQGVSSNTWKFKDEDSGIEFIRFFCKPDEIVMQWINEAWDEADEISINAVCKLSINQFRSEVTPQVTIIDCERCE